MSHSKKRTKKFGTTTASSEKEDKRIANRKFRRLVKSKAKVLDEDMPQIREVSNVWSFAKDGKRYYHNPDEKDMRK